MTDAEKTQFIAGVYGEEELLVHAARNAAELGEVVLQYRQAICCLQSCCSPKENISDKQSRWHGSSAF